MEAGFPQVLFEGHPVDDRSTFEALPLELQVFLHENNGFVAFLGGIHFRGCVEAPDWHSLELVWKGDLAFHKRFPKVIRPEDIPFAQNATGQQYLLRNGRVFQFDPVQKTVSEKAAHFRAFLYHIQNDPVHFLDLAPLVDLRLAGTQMRPGEILQPSGEEWKSVNYMNWLRGL